MALEDGTIPPYAIERAVAHRQEVVALEFDNGGIERGSWHWLNVGGRIRSMWTNPADPAVIVVCAAGGGMSLPIPNDTGLIGGALHAQGFAFDAA